MTEPRRRIPLFTNLFRRSTTTTDPALPQSPSSDEGIENSDEHNTSNNERMDEDTPPNPMELIVEENSRLQATVRDLTMELEDLQQSHMTLQSKSEDLEMKLQLERRRVDWQKKFYEKKILELVLNGNSCPASGTEGLLSSLSNSFYHEMIGELVAEQEKKDGMLKNLESLFQGQIQALEDQQKSKEADLEETHILEIQQLAASHEELIRDLLRGCEEGLFKEMKEEYLVEAETNVELQTASGNKIWVQFQQFSQQKKGVIVVAVCIISVATAGWASWGFVTWVWPRLVIFAESIISNPQILSTWTNLIVQFLNSTEFQACIYAWEMGQPLIACLKPFLKTALVAKALEMAPNLFSQLKRHKAQT